MTNRRFAAHAYAAEMNGIMSNCPLFPQDCNKVWVRETARFCSEKTTETLFSAVFFFFRRREYEGRKRLWLTKK